MNKLNVLKNKIGEKVSSVVNSNGVQAILPVITAIAVIIVVGAVIAVGTRELDQALTGLIHPTQEEQI